MSLWTDLTESWIIVHYSYKSSGSVWFSFLFPFAGGVQLPQVEEGEQQSLVELSHSIRSSTAAAACEETPHMRSHTFEVPCGEHLRYHRLTACPPPQLMRWKLSFGCPHSCHQESLFTMKKFDIHILQHKPWCHTFKSSCLPYLSICIGIHTSSRSETG